MFLTTCNEVKIWVSTSVCRINASFSMFMRFSITRKNMHHQTHLVIALTSETMGVASFPRILLNRKQPGYYFTTGLSFISPLWEAFWLRRNLHRLLCCKEKAFCLIKHFRGTFMGLFLFTIITLRVRTMCLVLPTSNYFFFYFSSAEPSLQGNLRPQLYFHSLSFTSHIEARSYILTAEKQMLCINMLLDVMKLWEW